MSLPPRLCLVLALAALLLVPPASRAGEVGVLIGSGHTVTAALPTGDEDAFALPLCEGDVVALSVKGKTVIPALRFFAPGGADRPLGEYLRGDGTARLSVKGFPVRSGEAGTWKVVVSAVTGAGDYTLKAKVKHAKPEKVKGRTIAAGKAVLLPVPASDGAAVTVTLKEKSGPALKSVRLLGPAGGEVAGAGAFARKGSKVAAKGILLAEGCLPHSLELTGDPGGDTVVDVKLKVKHRKDVKRKATLPPEPAVTSVEPDHVECGTPSAVVTFRGTGFLDGTTAETAAEGVTVLGTTVVGATAIEVTVGVEELADLGPIDVAFLPPPLEGEPFAHTFEVFAPAPVVTALTGSPIRQEDAATDVEITGEGFREGGEILVSGEGVTTRSTTVWSTTRATASLRVDADAPLGPRDVTFRQPLAGGGCEGSLPACLAVEYPVPELQLLSRRILPPGASVEVTLTGKGFRPGMEVTSSPEVSIESPTWVSNGLFTCRVVVPAEATRTVCPLTLTQPLVGGGASSERPRAFAIDPGEKLTAASPATRANLGRAVATDGDTIAAGSPQQNSEIGAVHLFEPGEAGFEETQVLEPGDGVAVDRFGYAVALSGDRLAVGAPYHDSEGTSAGAVYVYERGEDGFALETKLVPQSEQGTFGYAVSMDGVFLAVGAPRDDAVAMDAGAVFVYQRGAGGWKLYQSLRRPGGAESDLFGSAVAIDGETLVIGEPQADVAERDCGRALVYELSHVTGYFEEEAALEVATAAEREKLGTVVALEGDTAAITGPALGEVHLFERGSGWARNQSLDLEGHYTSSVAIEGDDLAVGDQIGWLQGKLVGSVFLFRRFGGSWHVQDQIFAADGAANDSFGYRVALSGKRIVAGAYMADAGETDAGAIYVFELP